MQTWHASITIKSIGFQRGASFSKIAILVPEHDSGMIDLLVTNSRWVEKHVALGLLYNGKMLRTGSARVDVLINDRDRLRKNFGQKYGLSDDTKIVMYAPTFRSGRQGTDRKPELQNQMPDFIVVEWHWKNRFGGSLTMVFHLHSGFTARHMFASLSGGGKSY